MAIKRYYNAEANPDGSQYMAGVPLDDLTDEQYDALPEWQQKQVDASPLYRKTEPRASKPESKKDETTNKKEEG